MKEKINKITYEIPPIIIYIVEFLISMNLMLNIKTSLILGVEKEKIPNLIICSIVVFSILLLAILIYNTIEYRKKLEKIFLTFMIPLGIFYMFFSMPNQVYDADGHVYRAYNISKNNIIEEQLETGEAKNEIPKRITNFFGNRTLRTYQDIQYSFDEEINYEDKKQVFDSLQGYSPTLYMFSSIVFYLGRHLGTNFMILVYIAEFCNFLFFLIIGYFSIKCLPFGKLLMLTYLFNPMLIHQAVSISADSLIDSTILFFIAYSIKIINQKDKISSINIFIISIFAILVAMAKYVYLPLILVLMILLFNNNNNSITKRKKIFIVFITIIAICMTFVWYKINSKFVNVWEYIEKNGINQKEQIKFILSNPLAYIGILINSTYSLAYKFIPEFLGYRLELVEAFNSFPCMFAYGFLLIFSAFADKQESEFRKRDRIIYLLLAIASYILVLTGLYITWTGVGSDCIADLQGRYFIPIFIVPLLCLIRKDKNLNYNSVKLYIFYMVFLVLINIQAMVPVIDKILNFKM